MSRIKAPETKVVVHTVKVTAPMERRWVACDLGLTELGLCGEQGLFLKEMGALARQGALQVALRELSRARDSPVPASPLEEERPEGCFSTGRSQGAFLSPTG